MIIIEHVWERLRRPQSGDSDKRVVPDGDSGVRWPDPALSAVCGSNQRRKILPKSRGSDR